MTGTRRRIGRLPRPGDDRGSIMMAFLVIVIAAGIGGMMLPALISQDRSTHFDGSRVRALHAAQTGIDVAIGQFRNATRTDTNGVTWGDDGDLPCYPATDTLVGQAGNDDSRYSVQVDYYSTDPSVGSPSPMICAPGYGPYDSTLGSRTPRYARITSTGTDLQGGAQKTKGRTLITTYVFQTDDTNISGGIIRLFPDTSGDQWCMDAGSAVPDISSGSSPIVISACSSSNPPIPQQVFTYRSDLSIQLVSSITAANPNGLCVDSATTPHAANVSVVLKKCAIIDPTKCSSVASCSPWNQQWSIDDNAHLEGAKQDKSTIDGYCVTAAGQLDSTPLKLQTCAGGVTDTKQTWVPAPTAGAGMAGAANNQLVNYKQFATCLDVTGQNPASTYLILYTCKQNPDPTKVAWNQKFAPFPTLATSPASVLLRTTYQSTLYCLTAPPTIGGYVRITTPCPASAAAAPSSQRWTVYQVKDTDGTTDLPYANKYRIYNAGLGACLGPGANSDLLNGQYYKVIAAPCDGSTGQKWNANPSLDTSKLQNTHETER